MFFAADDDDDGDDSDLEEDGLLRFNSLAIVANITA